MYRLLILTSLVISSIGIHADDLEHKTLPPENSDITIRRLAFGSCWKTNRSQKHWPVIKSNKPQLWLWLGDNIYGDSQDIDVLRQKYNALATTPGYRDLVKSMPVLATWDDHDYGANDAGRDFPIKEESQRLFLDFFNEPTDSIRRKQKGIYTSYYFGQNDKRVQIIILDTRYFRSPLKKAQEKPPYRRMGKWLPDNSPSATILGAEQWQWLEQELKKTARIRLIVSSIQFSAPHNGYETWANLPLEKQRMVDLITSTRAEGIVFLSGDIHSSELSIAEPKDCYPLIDFTSSSLNVPLGVSATRRRIGPAFGGANFALIEIDWELKDPVISLSIKDIENQTRLHHSVNLSKLTFSIKNLTNPLPKKHLPGEWQTFYGPLVLNKQDSEKWVGTCANRKLELQETNTGLAGTWQDENQSGRVKFSSTRDGKFLKGAYSTGNLPLQLDWAGWKADWEKKFTRDDYHLKKKK